jgi:dihydrofolate reductase
LGFVCSITDEADAILLGRISYQLINSHWPTAANKHGATENEIKYSTWYNYIPKYVLSKTLKTNTATNTYVIQENIESEINNLKQQPGKNILMFGSPTAVQSLFDLNLIDSFWIIVFRRKNITKLRLLASKQLSNGTLCNKYAINK